MRGLEDGGWGIWSYRGTRSDVVRAGVCGVCLGESTSTDGDGCQYMHLYVLHRGMDCVLEDMGLTSE